MSDADVVNCGHVVEEPYVLECSGDPRPGHLVGFRTGYLLAIEDDSATGWLEQAGDAVEKGGLAGAVGPNQRKDLASSDLKAHAVHRNQAAEALGQVGQLQDVVRGAGSVHHACACSITVSSSSTASCFSSCSLIRLGKIPCGRRSIIATRITPYRRNCRRCARPASPGHSPDCSLREPRPTALASAVTLGGSAGKRLLSTK